MDATTWSPLIREELARRADVRDWLFVDVPGFGGSDSLRTPVTLPQVGAAITSVLDELGVAQTRLVGHSMGGFLALDLAARAPDRFSSVATVSGAYSTIVDVVNNPAIAAVRFPKAAGTYLSLAAIGLLGEAHVPVMSIAHRAGLMRLALAGTTAHPMRLPDSLLQALVNGARPRSFRYAQATGVNYDYRSTWSSIQIPVLAIFGAQDALVGKRDARILRAANPTATTIFVEDAGHFVPIEQPGVLSNALNDWWVAL